MAATMIQIDNDLKPADLLPQIQRLWGLAAGKIRAIHDAHVDSNVTPVITVAGHYVGQDWTEWTRGFQFGAPLLLFDATDDRSFLELGRRQILERMDPHLTHFGVHDHGFNQVSTYGNLWRLMREGRLESSDQDGRLYELALKVSGAVQALRWTPIDDGNGYIYSFNGPHSLFSDTIRSLRALALAWWLGQALWTENDRRISLLQRLAQHAMTTARYNVYYGEQRDAYDVLGRVAHESIFNTNDGRYRCPSTQQGYSPFSTWTRGLAWIMLGFAEQLEFLAAVPGTHWPHGPDRAACIGWMVRAAQASCDFFLQHTPTCGVPYWDTGAPGLVHLPGYLDRPADPDNDHEPVDSSAAAIAAQGLLRLGRILPGLRVYQGSKRAPHFFQAGLTVLRTLLQEPYLSLSPAHQGLLLHTVYHRPRGWDHVPAGARTPRGEACMWGDYHLLEAALYVQRIARSQPDYRFFGPVPQQPRS